MHISKKLAIAAAAGALLGYAFPWRHVSLSYSRMGPIPHYGAEEIGAHLSVILIGAAAFIVLIGKKGQGAWKTTLPDSRGRRIALVLAAIACGLQVVFYGMEFSREAVDAGIGWYTQVAGAGLALAAAWLAKA